MSTSSGMYHPSGSQSSAGMYCSDCGASIAAASRFCQGCGKPHALAGAVRAVRTRVAWWDFVLLAFALFFSVIFFLGAVYGKGQQFHSGANLLGQYFSHLAIAYAVAYGFAGRKRVRNWHRFCLLYAGSLLGLALLDIAAMVPKAS